MDDLAARVTPRDRARSLFDLIDGNSLASERLGRLTDNVAEALHEARLFEMMLPERYGGWNASMRMFYDVVEEIARADGSAAWCVSLCNIINLTVFTGLPQEGRDEVYGHGPVTCWAALAPNAVPTPEAGGFRISCPGAFGSGSSLSRWVLVASFDGDPGAGLYRAYLVPKAEVEIDEGSWDVMGLRGTASVNYAIKDRFVPARRTWTYRWVRQEGDTGPLAVTESVRLNAIGLGAFASGLAQRAMDELLRIAVRSKRVAGDVLMAEDHVVQFGIGELDGRLRAARSHLLALTAALDERTAEGKLTTPEQALDITQATHTLTRVSREVVLFAFDCCGASVLYSRQPIQRCLRDILAGLKHAALTPSLLAGVGKARLGIPGGRAPL
jgi:alkylation response protein AidB-like acyl-CoA dehydrogenase